ncbi:MAG: hypothetical protein U0411_13435 [Thermodesulfovibrionales bacterium]
MAATSSSPVEVAEVRTARDLDAFIEVPHSLYSGDPHFCPQLTRDLRTHFSPKNPFFGHAEIKLFLARRGGRAVGRIASIVNRQHLAFHRELAGFFGFFECIDDREAAGALLERACGELKGRGMDIVRGPMNFSTNEECGFLIEGFGAPPMLMTPYNPPYYNELMEGFGMAKAKDLHAYLYTMEASLPEKVVRVASLATRKGITVRTITKKDFMADMKVFQGIYNAAWEKNWGFLPFTDEELAYSAERLKPLVVPELTLIAEKDGEPVGFLGLIPDFNSVLRRMKGRLNPVTLAKALYYSRKIDSLRLLLYGIKAGYRNRGVDALLFAEGHKQILRQGKYRRIEFSWILEDNLPVILITEMFGAPLYKKYRIYEKRISGQPH